MSLTSRCPLPRLAARLSRGLAQALCCLCAGASVAVAAVEVVHREADRRVDVRVDGKPFTSYVWPESLTKPVLYPLLTGRGTPVTRGFPLDPRPGERTDHPHHVGLWLNFGDVNGVDFWNNSTTRPAEEQARMGRSRHVRVVSAEGGQHEGRLRVAVEWVLPGGAVALDEDTTFVFRSGPARIIDRTSRLTARGQGVLFKDNKEGFLGLRVARFLEQPSQEAVTLTDSAGRPTTVAALDNAGVTGLYHSSEGKEGDAVWGTRGRWVALSGRSGNENVTVAILDHPKNPGAPTYWHARGYGLFAANNLGQRALSDGRESLDLRLAPGESAVFRWRIAILSRAFDRAAVEALSGDWPEGEARALAAPASPAAVPAERDLDVVLAGGRVIDPESGLDAIRHVGVKGDRIAALSEQPLEARLRAKGTRIDARGLVVAPGFIDLHAHGQSARANEFQVHDGVTTALELEGGAPQVARWLASRAGKARAHYGVSVSHGDSRTLALPGIGERAAAELLAVTGDFDSYQAAPGSALLAGLREVLPDDRLGALRAALEQGLREGALGIGMAHQYYPGADRREIFRVFQFAAEKGAPIFTHVREMGVGAMQEVIANAAATGASLHIVHVNSSSLRQLPVVLELVAGARQRGIDVTTEAYPYTAGSTGIESAIFDEGWREKLGIDYGDVQWQATRERLTVDSFARYRAQGGIVIIHMMKEEMIDLAMRTPFVMVASDGMPYAPGAHPRSAGTFARVLGRYVRERGVVGLLDALGKMTVMPARRLEGVAPGMKNKGRLREGADADVTVFDPATVKDTATFETDLSFSEGIRHVLVAGTFVVREGVTVEGAFPGRAITGSAR